MLQRVALSAVMLLPGSALSQSAATQPTAAPAGTPITTVGVNLNITPRRLTFDRNTRTATVYIFNQGTAAASFDVSLVDRVMLPDGEIKAAAEASSTPELKPIVDRLRSAQGLVIATPRRATLRPGKGQTIRVRANQPPVDSRDTGEYRTHLTVTTIPAPDVGLTAEQAAAQAAGEFVFRVQSVFGISIPVIVRPGVVDAKASIERVSVRSANLSPDGTAPPRPTSVVAFDIHRSGTNSVFGNIEIRSTNSADKEPLGIARGVGVYPEIDRRSIRIPLRRPLRPGEQVSIIFTDDDAKPGSVIARSSFTAS